MRSVKKRWSLKNYIYTLAVSNEEPHQNRTSHLKLPIFKADIAFRETKTHRICTVRDSATLDLIMELDSRKPPNRGGKFLRLLPALKLGPLYSGLGVRIVDLKLSVLIPRMAIRFGSNHLAGKMRQFNVGRQWLFVFAPRCRGSLKFSNITEA